MFIFLVTHSLTKCQILEKKNLDMKEKSVCTTEMVYDNKKKTPTHKYTPNTKRKKKKKKKEKNVLF